MTNLERLAEKMADEFVDEVLVGLPIDEEMVHDYYRKGIIAGAKKMQELCVEIAEGMLETCTQPEDRNVADELRIVRRKMKSLTEERAE